MTSSAQLEHEAERTRSDLANTIQELRSRLTVGHLADEVWVQIRDGYGRDIARGIAHQVAENPLPSALIGAGLAWMLYGAGSGSSTAPRSGVPRVTQYDHRSARTDVGSGAYQSNPKSTVSTMANETTSAVNETASSAASTIGAAAEEVGNAASSAYETVADGVSQAASAVGEGASRVASAVAEGSQSAMKNSGATARRLVDFCVDHPLVLAGAGLAIGAAIGAALPVSETENKLLGKTSDEVKRTAEHVAADQLGKAETVAEKIVDDVATAADASLETPASRPSNSPTSDGIDR